MRAAFRVTEAPTLIKSLLSLSRESAASDIRPMSTAGPCDMRGVSPPIRVNVLLKIDTVEPFPTAPSVTSILA